MLMNTFSFVYDLVLTDLEKEKLRYSDLVIEMVLRHLVSSDAKYFFCMPLTSTSVWW